MHRFNSLFNNLVKYYVQIGAILIFSVLFFLFVYTFDNKYTHPANQAVDGYLQITKTNMHEYPVRYLTDGWRFYPDKLLKPSDLSNSGLYNTIVTIGEYTGLSNSNSNTIHGSGTYVMQIMLPENKQTYALGLPEIFSAYHLYIDNDLVLTVGTPEKDNYSAKTQKRVVTFNKSGLVTITIAVSDYSHYYSGMVYPPAFGYPKDINTSRGIRLCFHMLIISFGIFATIMSLYFGIALKKRIAMLFSFLTLFMSFITADSVLHTVACVSVTYWYTFELASGYIFTLLVIILHNYICKTQKSIFIVSISVAAIMVVISVIFGLTSSILTIPALKLFSKLVSIYKYLLVLYLLIQSYMRCAIKDKKAIPLFSGTVFYATNFLMDRRLPDYEPIYCCYFNEWGSVILVCTIAYTLWRDMATEFAYSLSFREQEKQMKRQLSMQIEYSRQLSESADNTRKLIHDFRHHIRIISQFASKYNDAELTSYLSGLDNFTTGSSAPKPFCNNTALNATLHVYYSSAVSKLINTEVRFIMPSKPVLSDIEFCTVLSNLFENAIEACEKLETDKRRISLNCRDTSGSYFLLIENTYNGEYKKQVHVFVSSKTGPARLGIGLESVTGIIEKNGGTIDIYPKENTFSVGINIPY